MNPQGLPISWFDFVVIIVVLVGVARGRRHGMSQELLGFFMWLGIVFGGAYASRQGAPFLVSMAKLAPLWAHILAYLGAGLLVFIIFAFLKNALRDKLAGSDFFKGLEYPLGMLAGGVRFACILMAVLALLNARQVTDKEREEIRKKQEQNFGSISFPTLGETQYTIFRVSFCGKFVKEKLDWLLIDSSAGKDEDRGESETIGRRRTRDLEKIMGK